MIGVRAEHDVRRTAHVELVARHDFLRANRAADDRAAFEHEHLAAGLGEIAGADQPVVARADDDAIIGSRHHDGNVARGRRGCVAAARILLCPNAPMLTKEFFTRHPARLRAADSSAANSSGTIAAGSSSRPKPTRRSATRPATRSCVAARRSSWTLTRPGTAYIYLNYGVHWLLNVLIKGPEMDGFVLDPRARTPARAAAHAGAPRAGRTRQTLLRSRQAHAGARHPGDVPRIGPVRRSRAGRSTRARRTRPPRRSWRTFASASRARRSCRGVFSRPAAGTSAAGRRAAATAWPR